MGALYHLKQKLVDFCNVIQENVSRTDTVPSSKVVYDLKADSDSQISDLNDSLTNKLDSASIPHGLITVTGLKQGGYNPVTVNITFAQPFVDTNYTVILSNNSGGGGDWNMIEYGVQNKTVSGFQIIVNDNKTGSTTGITCAIGWIAIKN